MASYTDVIKARKRRPKWPRTLTMWGVDIVSEAQWSDTMNDGRRFVAAGWPHQAAALGWTEENAIGLMWSLRGRRVVAMTTGRAAIVSQRCSDVLQADGGVMIREKRLRGSWISAM